MPVLKASNNGGRYNTVHNQTDDGSVFSVLVDGEYVPISFSWIDYLGTCQTNLISSGRYYHDKLMRSDCGVREKDDSEDLLFSWKVKEQDVDGFSNGPSNEFSPIISEHINEASCVRLDGLESRRKTFYRKDREYWTPGVTLAATTEEDLFGFEQYNPMACPPDEKDNCGNYILKGDKKKC